MKDFVFSSFGVFILLCAAVVVFARNAIYSAFAMVLCFFGLAAVYVLWGAPFIAMIQILIYTGAIVVLFVFVVMILDLGKRTLSGLAGWFNVFICSSLVWCFAFLLLRVLNQTPFFSNPSALPNPNPSDTDNALLSSASGAGASQMVTLSQLLFTDYLWPFEILSVFLLALTIAIYVLARPELKLQEGETAT